MIDTSHKYFVYANAFHVGKTASSIESTGQRRLHTRNTIHAPALQLMQMDAPTCCTTGRDLQKSALPRDEQGARLVH